MSKKKCLKLISVMVALLMLASVFAACAPMDNGEISGANGKTAYQLARENGFVGSEQEWLNSLNEVANANGGQVTHTYKNSDNHLILILQDGTHVDAGYVGNKGSYDGLRVETPENPPEENYVIVRFLDASLDSGSEVVLHSTLIERGDCVDIPASPQKDGYTFIGWYSDVACTYSFDFSAPIYDSITNVYAKWESNNPDDDGSDAPDVPEVLIPVEVRQELENLQRLNNGSMPEISVNGDNYQPSFVAGTFSSTTVTDHSSAISAMGDVSSIMGFGDVAQEFAGAGSSTFGDTTQYRLQQTYGGYEVYGKQMIVTTNQNGMTTALSGAYTPVAATLNSYREITAEVAANIVEANGFGAVDPEDAMLVIYTLNGYNEFAFIFNTGSYTIAVSAVDGELIGVSMNISYDVFGDTNEMTNTIGRAESTDTSMFNTVSYEDYFIFYDMIRNIVYHNRGGLDEMTFESYIENQPLTDDDNVWTDDYNTDAAIELYGKLAIVYDYYLDSLGLVSFDGNGGRVLAYVNDGFDGGENAFSVWGKYDDGSNFTILAFGSNAGFHNDVDVVAHEYTHSIQRDLIPELVYSNETGAIMEAYADIMGELIQIDAEDYADWICTNRNIADPASSNNPVRYNGARYYTGTNDNGGVHDNSTVVSHALYNVYNSGIVNVDAMSELLYRAWSYLTPTATFFDYRMAVLAAAKDMNLGSDAIATIADAFDDAGIVPTDFSEIIENEVEVTVTVLRAENSEVVPNATVTAKRPGATSDVVSTSCNNNGVATFSLIAGNYEISVSATGYEDYTVSYSVDNVDAVSMLVRLNDASNQEGIVCELGGIVTDAMTNSPLYGATLNFRKGYNVTTGRVDVRLTTDGNGAFYTDALDYGYYTIEVLMEGYIVSYVSVQSAASNWADSIRDDALNQNISISPNITVDDALRIVLTWGEHPSDLDSHLHGINADGDVYHVAYYNKTSTIYSDTVASLDIDDTTSYGPETITVYLDKQGGNFSYIIHDYSNRDDAQSTDMSLSSAKVQVFSGNTLLAVYNIPTNIAGTAWHVFDVDVSTGELITVNNFFSPVDSEHVTPNGGHISGDSSVG